MFTKYNCTVFIGILFNIKYSSKTRVQVLKGQCAEIKLFFSPDKVHGHILNHNFHNHKL